VCVHGLRAADAHGRGEAPEQHRADGWRGGGAVWVSQVRAQRQLVRVTDAVSVPVVVAVQYAVRSCGAVVSGGIGVVGVEGVLHAVRAGVEVARFV
jgi:hypothetical protein